MQNIDILLVAEGTYPFVRGGVSSWIHQLITGLPEFSFGIVFIGSRKEDYGEMKYKLPENIVYFTTTYLFDKEELPDPKPLKFNRKLLKKLEELHSTIKAGKVPKILLELKTYANEITETEFLYSRTSWEFITDSYLKLAQDYPFVEYFWTVRNIHIPIWRVSRLGESLPKSSIVHSPSTGYAGFLSSLISRKWNCPFILTEHGIYTKERKIDILISDFIKEKRFFFQKEYGEIGHIKKLWINFFYLLGKLSYEAAVRIISLYEDARRIQIKLGAPPEKTAVIPNGVKVEYYLKAREENRNAPPVIALIGRVVPIKDIKTFIKAMRIVVDRIPEAEGWIVGPTDEDPDYYEECRKLVNVLRLKQNVKFLGFRNVKEILSQVKLTTLTSISEGMPLVVLESFAAGVPCVATDVGACRQLIHGGISEEDKRLGKAGEIVSVANPGEAAESYIKFLTNKETHEKARKVAIKRVEKFYSFEKFLDSYRNLYRSYLNGRHSF